VSERVCVCERERVSGVGVGELCVFVREKVREILMVENEKFDKKGNRTTMT